MTMTKADRAQLQTLVKRRFKGLRTEVRQRHSELIAEMEAEISQRYADEDRTYSAALAEVREATLACNRQINDIWRRCLGDRHEEMEWVRSMGTPPSGNEQQRAQLRRQTVARIDEQVQSALTELERRELKLLEDLLIGGLETDEAQQFLAEVPTVAQLVPSTRLAELEISDG